MFEKFKSGLFQTSKTISKWTKNIVSGISVKIIEKKFGSKNDLGTIDPLGPKNFFSSILTLILKVKVKCKFSTFLFL